MQRGSLKAVLHRGVKVWRLQWRESGRGRTRILGRCNDMSRDEADAERYVEGEYLTVKARVWKASTRATTEQIIETHILFE